MARYFESEFNYSITQLLEFYAPNFEDVEGAYWFGPIRLSVTVFDSWETQELLMLDF